MTKVNVNIIRLGVVEITQC